MERSLVLDATEIITSVERSKEVVGQLVGAGQPIGVDAEGVELGPKGKGWNDIFQSGFIMNYT